MEAQGSCPIHDYTCAVMDYSTCYEKMSKIKDFDLRVKRFSEAIVLAVRYGRIYNNYSVCIVCCDHVVTCTCRIG